VKKKNDLLRVSLNFCSSSIYTVTTSSLPQVPARRNWAAADGLRLRRVRPTRPGLFALALDLAPQHAAGLPGNAGANFHT